MRTDLCHITFYFILLEMLICAVRLGNTLQVPICQSVLTPASWSCSRPPPPKKKIPRAGFTLVTALISPLLLHYRIVD